jgi:geranylgeranylglycerol-phosphate geranylgeranyltransferase
LSKVERPRETSPIPVNTAKTAKTHNSTRLLTPSSTRISEDGALSKLVAYFRIIRPANCLMMGFAVIVGVVLSRSNSPSVPLPNLFYGFVTGFALTAGSMAANDYCDREIDSINEPNRPIPSGVIDPKEALAFALILAVVGFGAAILTSVFSLIVAAVSWVVFIAYTTVGKRTGLLGNFLVSACVAIPFVYGSVVATDAIQLTVLFFVLMVFLSNTGREITKGIVDVEGDREQNVRTLAVRFGSNTAAVAAGVFYISATLLSPIPVLLDLVSFWFIPLVAVTDIGLWASSIVLLKDHSRESARRIKRIVLLWFVVGLLAFLIGAAR